MDLNSGATRSVDCGTIVFTVDWIPDRELAALTGIELDPGTHGPVDDPSLQTSRPSEVEGLEGGFRLRTGAFLRRPIIRIEQDERELWSGRTKRLVPGRSLRLPSGWIRSVDPEGGRVTVGLPSGGNADLAWAV